MKRTKVTYICDLCDEEIDRVADFIPLVRGECEMCAACAKEHAPLVEKLRGIIKRSTPPPTEAQRLYGQMQGPGQGWSG